MPAMTFHEIPIRMLQLGLDRPWLAQECDYKPGSLAQILAPNGNQKFKTDKALRRIWEALDREEERQRSASKLPEPLGHRVFIEPTEDQFDRWMTAVYSRPGRTFDSWAKEGLDQLADEELGDKGRKHQFPATGKMIDLPTVKESLPVRPHLAAAAGPAIDAEVIETLESTIRVRICGRSMEPRFSDGDVVEMHSRTASRTPYMKKGLIYLVRTPDGYAVKRFNTRQAAPEESAEEWAARGKVGILESINPAFPPITIKSEIEWLAWLD